MRFWPECKRAESLCGRSRRTCSDNGGLTSNTCLSFRRKLSDFGQHWCASLLLSETMRTSMLCPSFRHLCSLGRLRSIFNLASCLALLGTAGGCTSTNFTMPERPSSTGLKGSIARILQAGQRDPATCLERLGICAPHPHTTLATPVVTAPPVFGATAA